jgi:beta-galactosidase
MRAMGLRMVDTYVPWGVHEEDKGDFDFGARDGRKDVARFVRMVGERGMFVVLRPGPHINAELTYFGLPERIVWDRECQSRTPRDNPVMLPIVPVAFPVPSYASDAFHDETARWFDAVGEQLSALRWPDGPIVMVQVDNEGALYFRDGPYDQDYHPDAVRLFRSHLRAKYKRVADLRAAWRDEEVQFVTAIPPVRMDAKNKDELARHLDWMEFHEQLLAGAFERMKGALDSAGLGELPTLHNFPLGEGATPLNAARMARTIDLVGLDYYHRAAEHPVILRRTTEVASRSEGIGQPAYGAELGAGFPPFFAPIDEKDSLYTLLAALAYGLRGFNLYMAVDRDRWIGAPIDVRGNPRPLADRYKALFAALDRVQFHTLRRRAPVRLLVPRALRRLARATHAFGPITPAIFAVLGAGWSDSCTEMVGDEANPAIDAEAFLRAFEAALAARGVPYAYASGETLAASTKDASWVICPTGGGLKHDIYGALRALTTNRVRVTVGPSVSERDGAMRSVTPAHDTHGLEIEPLGDRARADALVARFIEELDLPTYPVDPPDAYVAVHEDEEGVPRVVFVMNPTDEPVEARVGLPESARELVPLWPTRADEESHMARKVGGFEVHVGAREVRMLEVR